MCCISYRRYFDLWKNFVTIQHHKKELKTAADKFKRYLITRNLPGRQIRKFHTVLINTFFN